MIDNQIPRYDIIRKNYESRYYIVDSNMSGYFRFSYAISNDEAILKDGTFAKNISKVLSGSRSITLDNTLIGIRKQSYIKIGNDFYLVESVQDKTIYIYDSFHSDIEEGTDVRLFSNYIKSDNEGVCTKFKFVVGDVLEMNNETYRLEEDTTIDDVYNWLSARTMTSRFGDTFYIVGELISAYSYETYSTYPVESGFLNIQSNNYIVPGDCLLLFNEDIRANNNVWVTEIREIQCASGFKYIAKVSELSGVFKYGQLRAFPAYKSKKLDIHKCKPSLVDICGDTVYGKDVKIVKGIKLYSTNEEITRGFEDLSYVANLETEPSDLWLNEVIYGKTYPKLPNISCVTDESGIFKMYIDSKIPEEFILKFSSAFPDVKISVTDLDGNILALGSVGDILECRLNKVLLNIKTSANTGVDLVYFKARGVNVHFIEYYFVCQEINNERMEVNSLHLNPVFRNYKEMVAVIGRDKAGEGRIAL